ncbi:MAG: TonB-dependent receptor, partial [Alistipes sp.]|nr:TonB-dependent receptor [Candidatus Minthomonas equi]
NKPVPYASVYWLETGAYMDCDEKGVFEFTIFGDKEAVLVATAVGYTTDTVTVNNTTTYVEFHLGTTSELQGAVITGYGVREHIAKTMNIKTEVITAAGLCKMACCSVAESFENSASVSVGYSDAITGARQIRLLGLSGVYTSMLDENRPTMRGLASPFGLSYVPGQWLESIQIAKGPSSVINSTEAITGQINMEHRKPTDEKPLYANLFFSSELAGEANIASSLQLNDRWSTVILGHFSTMPKIHDMNEDGFMDSPLTTHVNFSNRWLYYDPSGIQIRFGVKGLYDDRLGGSTDFKKGDENRSVEDLISSGLWGSRIVNKNFNAYLKAGFPLNWRNTMNIAGVVDYVHHDIGSNFGIKAYDGSQNSLFANIIYQYVPNDSHRINAGVRNQFDSFNELLKDRVLTASSSLYDRSWDLSRKENTLAAYAEYTFSHEDKISVSGSLSVDVNSLYGTTVSPRMNARFTPIEWLTFRASGGEGHRSPNVVVDNIGMLSTGRMFSIASDLQMEKAWTYGGSITFDIPVGVPDNCWFSVDFFHSDFVSQVIADQECVDATKVMLYNLDGQSYTNTYQADFSIEPFDRFTVLATFRYTDSKVTLADLGLVERPLQSRWKGVLNLQYATKMSKWVFDFTAQLNGPARIPAFAARRWGYDESPVYPVLFAQVTRKFKGIEVYAGGENLTGYTQARYLNTENVIDASNPFSSSFNASSVWGPLMGITVYAGVRFTLWKQE